MQNLLWAYTPVDIKAGNLQDMQFSPKTDSVEMTQVAEHMSKSG